jgi:aspartyl aminopeptidase
MSFVEAAPSSYHAAREIKRRALAEGGIELNEREPGVIEPGQGYVVVRDGAAIAFITPHEVTPNSNFTIIGTHTDSPGFKLKPHPTFGVAGFWQAGMEIYGRPLLNSWLDRELELAGRIVTNDGMVHLVRTGPMFRIPQLAIHLDRTQNDKLVLDWQRDTQPVWGLGDIEDADVLSLLASCTIHEDDIPTETIVGYDIVTVDSQPPRIFGANNSMLASGRLDNLLGTHAAISALFALDSSVLESIAMVVAFDHEEVGSQTRSGAHGSFLEDVLRRIVISLWGNEENLMRSLAGSWHISCDVGHAVHPNRMDRYDPNCRPLMGRGPILKINANQRYATDAVTAGLWNASCEAAGIPHQSFVSNNSVPCGTTTGPISATRLGIRTVDVGAPILSMHSARELASVDDTWNLCRALTEALKQRVPE